MFYADVWGTVSDWAAVIVYAVTGFFIYRTLKMQVTVTNSQVELLRIEQVRYRKQLQPELSISGNLMQAGNEYLLYFTLVNISSNTAVNISFLNHKSFLPKEIDDLIIPEIKANSTYVILNGHRIIMNYSEVYNFDIVFFDIDNNQYIQAVTGFVRDPDISSVKYTGNII